MKRIKRFFFFLFGATLLLAGSWQGFGDMAAMGFLIPGVFALYLLK